MPRESRSLREGSHGQTRCPSSDVSSTGRPYLKLLKLKNGRVDVLIDKVEETLALEVSVATSMGARATKCCQVGNRKGSAQQLMPRATSSSTDSARRVVVAYGAQCQMMLVFCAGRSINGSRTMGQFALWLSKRLRDTRDK